MNRSAYERKVCRALSYCVEVNTSRIWKEYYNNKAEQVFEKKIPHNFWGNEFLKAQNSFDGSIIHWFIELRSVQMVSYVKAVVLIIYLIY